MSERTPVRPTDGDNVGWNTGSIGASTDPGALRVSGWAVDAIPGSDEFNYLQTLWGDFFLWLEGSAQRRFDDVYEGIAATVDWQSFIWRPSNPAWGGRMAALAFSAHGNASGNNIAQLCTDGAVIFGHTAANADLVALTPGGTDLWALATIGGTVTAICTDGLYLYESNGTNNGIRARRRSDGAVSATSAEAYAGYAAMAANGAYIVAIAPAGATTRVHFYTEPATYVNFVTAPNPAGCVALGDRMAYVGCDDAVTAYLLSTRALMWTYNYLSALAVAAAIDTDSDLVFVASNRHDRGAGVYSNLVCLDALTGAELWFADIGSVVDLTDAVCDGKYLFVREDTAGGIYQLAVDAHGYRIVVYGGAAVAKTLCCDGAGLAYAESATPTDLDRFMVGDIGTRFLRVKDSDQYRRPRPWLAVPMR